jgi:hypothetical protein
MCKFRGQEDLMEIRIAGTDQSALTTAAPNKGTAGKQGIEKKSKQGS